MPVRRALRVSCGAALLSTALAAVARTPATDGPPYSPADSMRTMRLEAGFRIELVASEPDVQSPVALEIDEDGRMFVVEMPGYPLDVSPTGRVKLLQDTNGDGRFDRTTIFADALVLPTGVMRWKQGILVTAAPDVVYFEDTDGDGRADVRTVMLTGFARSNPQHTVNTPLYGLDNWIYVAHQGASGAVIYKDLFGDRGRPLTFPERSGQPGVDPGDSTVRFRLDRFEVEPIAGESQFGHTFDAYGRYFGNDNSHHLWHEVIRARYLRRNPHLLVRSVMHDVPEHGAAAQVFPISQRPNFELLTEAGEFTSASAPTMYLGGAFPEGYEGSVFVAEPVHNLVHRDVLSPAGATFRARRGHADREFLAAGDAWFRPVNFHVGPDGALYLVDYYRARIEHPEWASSEAQRDPSAFYLGQDRGRIYRILPESASVARGVMPGAATVEQLVATLAHPNGWQRRTAQRLLVTRSQTTAVPALRRLAQDSAAPLGRLHALWTLEGLGALDVPAILRALGDSDPGVRENAVLLAELNGSVPGLDERLAALAADPDPRVRFQVLATLGGLGSPAALAAHERLLFQELQDAWMQVAGLSADSERAAQYFAGAVAGAERLLEREIPGRALFVGRVAGVIGARAIAREAAHVLATIEGRAPAGDWWRAAALNGLAEGARGRGDARTSLQGSRTRLLELAASSSADIRAGVLRLLAITGVGSDEPARQALHAAEQVARSRTLDDRRRADAIGLLALDTGTDRQALLQALVDPREPETVQAAAVKALGHTPGKAIGRFLLARWGKLTPAVRSEAAGALLNDEARSWLLVAALRAGEVQPWALNFWEKRRLLMNRNPGIRQASRAILEEDPRQRGETVRRYAAALDLAGDAANGRQVFDRACATCHALGNHGSAELGPDLATVRHRPPLLLLADILLPSQSIAQKYETYVVERVSGGTEAGVLAAQTPTSITLRQGPDQQITIDRRDIRSLTVTPQSSMPGDLDKAITPAEMADLLAYIRQGGT